jgi:hydrogenase maturation protease
MPGENAMNTDTPNCDATVLVIGYGNPQRQDDGLGPALAAELRKLGGLGVTVRDGYRLDIHDAVDVAEHDVIWFVDAVNVGASPFSVTALWPAVDLDFGSHLLNPETILALVRKYYGRAPRAFLVSIRGYEFDFVEELTAGALDNLRLAVSMLIRQICAPSDSDAATRTEAGPAGLLPSGRARNRSPRRRAARPRQPPPGNDPCPA